MKAVAKSILFTFILATSSSLLVAQPGSNYAEQWYRAKFGRPSPTEQARIDATQKRAVAPADSSAVLGTKHGNPWLEQLYQAKHGRPTPNEEARLREANLGRDSVMTSKLAPVDDQFENWFRAKYGRASR